MDIRLIAFSLRPLALLFVFIAAGCTSPDRSSQTVTNDTRARLAKALLEAGDPASAAEAMRTPASRAAQETPDDLSNAQLLIAAGKVDAGLNVAEAALAARGDDPAFALSVASLAVKANRLQEAQKIYQAILLRHSDNIEAMNGEAVVLAQGGNLTEAMVLLRRVLARDPGNVAARSNLALVLLLSGQAQAAIPILEELDRSAPSPQVTATLAAARAQNSDPASSGTVQTPDRSPAEPIETLPVSHVAAAPAFQAAASAPMPPAPAPATVSLSPIAPPAAPMSTPVAPPSSASTPWSCPATCQLLHSLFNSKADNDSAQ
jgi:Flp pilus assembly protein TadD